MKFYSKVLMAALLSASLLAGCTPKQSTTATPAPSAPAATPASSTTPAPAAGGEVKIGIISPLSGAVSVYGVASTNGTKLAFDEINKAGGIGGKKINYVSYDDKGDSTESVNAYNKLANSDKVTAVIGAVTSGPTATMASAAQKDFMPIITPTGTAEELTKLGENVFRACYLDSYQALTMADFASQNLTAQKAAVMYNSSDDYSTGLAENFKKRFEANGGKVVSFQAYISGDTDFKAQLTSIKSQTPDVIFLPDYYNTIALIAKQVKDVGITSKLLGADGWDGLFTVLDDKSLVQGAYYCSHYAVDDPDPVVQNFIKTFQDTYKTTPNSFAALGYDAAKIMAAAIEKAGSADKKAIVEALKATSYNGVTGKITFDANGDPIKNVAILTVDNGQVKLSTKIQPK